MAEETGKYDHAAIERKWQAAWASSDAFAAPQHPRPGKKIYILDMFPYPSGAGLHVGHVEGYTATDIYSRYKRMRGYDVLHPMGWDAFGLPAENYAIKTGIPPAKTTNDAIETFRRQIKSIGLSYDWSREVAAHTPEYYRWTQWFFLFLYKNGLAYKKKALVNWDPVDQTVLANEQVLPDGTAERSGAKVVKKELEQWFFKITDFADALADDLDQVDWPESTKIAQRNWIGRSEGAQIDFALTDGGKLTVFTTRPDTLFGATYMVIAPEHELAKKYADDKTLQYIESAKNKSDIDRSAEGREKTGVELSGIKAINPATKEEIPVFVADYVLGNYGTGAIMAVPAHDERDFEFAKKFNIPIRRVIEPLYVKGTGEDAVRVGKPFVERQAIIAVVRDPKADKYLVLRWKSVSWTTFITGGIEAGQSAEEAARAEIAQETGYTNLRLVKQLSTTHTQFFHVPKNENRYGHFTGFLFELESDVKAEVSADELAKHEPAWVSAAEAEVEFDAEAFLQLLAEATEGERPYTGAGLLANSGQFDRLESEEAKKKITELVGGKMVKTYRLRDWLISRQRYWGAPIPVVYDPEGNAHPVPEEHLPWLLPTDVEFKPTGTSPLGQSKELLERTERIFGKRWRPEVDTMDTFVCSSWYYYRFADPHNDAAFASKEAIAKWLPVDLYVGGAEHTVLHLLYARFFTKALERHGLVSFSEPFLKLRHQGTILAEDGNKMSKSKGNVINPDDVVAEFGADTLRLYEMFMGPLEMQKPWSTKNILGSRRFLDRVWRLQSKVAEADNPAVDTTLQQTIKKVTDDIEALKFNTAISQLMIFLNASEEGIGARQWAAFVQLLAPFAPHMAYELAERRGIDLALWPAYDESKLASATVTVAVQVGGKARTTVVLGPDAPEPEAVAAATAAAAKWLTGPVTKVIYKPGRVINLII